MLGSSSAAGAAPCEGWCQVSVQIAVASVTLGSGFPGLVYSQIKKNLRAGESLVECATIMSDVEFARPRMLALLETVPRPVALIGICIRPDPVTLAAYRAAGVPVVLVDEEAEGVSTVASDNFAGGYLAGKHLAAAGRKRIAVVSGETGVTGGYNAAQRVKGMAKALGEHGLSLAPEDRVEVVQYSRREGAAAMSRFLDAKRWPDAIFCAAGDTCATGLLAAARERRVKVPEEVAVVGYDDSPLAGISDPPLTTVRQPLDRIAREAHRLATEEAATILAKPKAVLFEPTLVVRASA